MTPDWLTLPYMAEVACYMHRFADRILSSRPDRVEFAANFIDFLAKGRRPPATEEDALNLVAIVAEKYQGPPKPQPTRRRRRPETKSERVPEMVELSILRALEQGMTRTKTVAQVSRALGMPESEVYGHFDCLVRQGSICRGVNEPRPAFNPRKAVLEACHSNLLRRVIQHDNPDQVEFLVWRWLCHRAELEGRPEPVRSEVWAFITEFNTCLRVVASAAPLGGVS